MKGIDSQISPILMSDDASVLAFSKRQVLLQESVNDLGSPTRLPGRHEFPDTRFKTEGAEQEERLPTAVHGTPDDQDGHSVTIVLNRDSFHSPSDLRIEMTGGSWISMGKGSQGHALPI